MHFVFTPPYVENLDQQDQNRKDSRFRLVFASNPTLGLPRVADYGHEIEAQPDLIQSISESAIRGSCQSFPIRQATVEKKTKVQFSLTASAQDNISIPDLPEASPISDICHTLSTTQANGEHFQLLGSLSDDSYRHDMYYVRSYAEKLKSQSLADLIAAAGNPGTMNRFIFPQRHRLRLAVNLACSVLQFHGSWLKTQWRARDIMFNANTSTDVENPYVLWNMIDAEQKGKQKASAALIRSEILFPLGLALVELSLCQTIESLRTPDDVDQDEAHTNLKTAARHLQYVETESGEDYGKVVDRCLFWPGIKEPTLDNEKLQDEVFQMIVLPLIEHLNNFEGRSHMY